MQKKHNIISCSVGILTFNSGKYLERCLKSLVGFGEIIIADGGSTDNTLKIAKKYHCKIIQQSNPEHSIEDFALERNRILDVALHGWFFYLDSDEIMSDKLKEDISNITTASNQPFLVYRVRYQIVSEDVRIWYKSFKSYYQTRLFNKKCKARFIKKMHEKIVFDKKYKIGTINNPWLVPLDVQLDFGIYKEKVQKRLGVIVNDWTIKNPFKFIKHSVFIPMFNIGKNIIKIIYIRVKYNKKEIIPLQYEMYRIYSQFVFMKKLWIRYLHVIFSRK